MKLKFSKVDLWCIFAPIPVLTLLTIFNVVKMWEGAVVGYAIFLVVYFLLLRGKLK